MNDTTSLFDNSLEDQLLGSKGSCYNYSMSTEKKNRKKIKYKKKKKKKKLIEI